MSVITRVKALLQTVKSSADVEVYSCWQAGRQAGRQAGKTIFLQEIKDVTQNSLRNSPELCPSSPETHIEAPGLLKSYS